MLVLAGLGVVSLVDDDKSLNRDEVLALAEARQPASGAAGEITRWWAIAHRRDGETIPSRGCGFNGDAPPYHHICTVTFRSKSGRYRGFQLTIEETKDRHFSVVRVRARKAGPAG